MIYLRCKLIFFHLYGFLGFPINIMLCLLFSKKKNDEKNTVHKHLKNKRKELTI